jgi:hypothetical protein
VPTYEKQANGKQNEDIPIVSAPFPAGKREGVGVLRIEMRLQNCIRVFAR